MKKPLSSAIQITRDGFSIIILIYLAIGFVGTLLALEIGWHFTGCSISDKTMKPCLFKQIKLALINT
jgi:hypothetical protein